ncbi:hypothetical protein fHeYen902_108c [Yersinia phage fHe-Yen9-02]|nr:hypothetical protein fHeYen902_108c [Yersinia phage fHe-Yen9-02]
MREPLDFDLEFNDDDEVAENQPEVEYDGEEEDEEDYQDDYTHESIGPEIRSVDLQGYTYLGYVVRFNGADWMFNPHVLTYSKDTGERILTSIETNFILDGLVSYPIHNQDDLFRTFPKLTLGLATVSGIPIPCSNVEH